MGQAPVTAVTVTAHFRAAAGRADELVPLLIQLANHSRGERGCVDYGYFRQSENFTSIEHWASPEDEAAHNDTDFLHEILRQILPLLDGRPQVTRWQRVA